MTAHRRTLAALAVVLMLLAAGCMDVTVTTEITETGEIDRMELEMETLTAMYMLLEQEAEEEGYDSVEAMLRADFLEDFDEGAVGSVEVEIEDLGEDDGHLFVIVAEDIDPAGMAGVTITVDGDTVRYEAEDGFDSDPFFDDDWDTWGDDWDDWEDDDWDPYAEAEDLEVDLLSDIGAGEDLFADEMEILEYALDELISIEYVVSMPGEIDDHNADELRDGGTTAVWTADFTALEDEPETFYAEATVDPDPLPGFGAVAALAALLVSLAAVGVRLR